MFPHKPSSKMGASVKNILGYGSSTAKPEGLSKLSIKPSADAIATSIASSKEVSSVAICRTTFTSATSQYAKLASNLLLNTFH